MKSCQSAELSHSSRDPLDEAGAGGVRKELAVEGLDCSLSHTQRFGYMDHASLCDQIHIGWDGAQKKGAISTVSSPRWPCGVTVGWMRGVVRPCSSSTSTVASGRILSWCALNAESALTRVTCRSSRGRESSLRFHRRLPEFPRPIQARRPSCCSMPRARCALATPCTWHEWRLRTRQTGCAFNHNAKQPGRAQGRRKPDQSPASQNLAFE